MGMLRCCCCASVWLFLHLFIPAGGSQDDGAAVCFVVHYGSDLVYSPACNSVNACEGNRTGQLCGGCSSGTVVAIGTPYCVPLSWCHQGRGLVWVGVVAALLVAGAVQLTLVSNVWVARSRMLPSGKIKLAIYFFQVRCVM